MYGFPLTIYLLSHFLGIRVSLGHISGHLLGDLITSLGLGNGWFIVMLVSNVLIALGIYLVTAGWELVYGSKGKFVTKGIYARMRHPQYTGIYIITLGFMIQWPTLPTLIFCPLSSRCTTVWPGGRRRTCLRSSGMILPIPGEDADVLPPDRQAQPRSAADLRPPRREEGLGWTER